MAKSSQHAEGQTPSPILYVLATPIGNLSDISKRALEVLNEVDLIACEDTRVTGKLFELLELKKKPFISYRDANEKAQAEHLVERMQSEGLSIALLCDAGTPTLSDPGFRIVRQCRKEGIPVTPIPGPAAAIAALCASGLPSDKFSFLGFLPNKGAARRRFLEAQKNLDHTVIVYESAHRIEKCMADLIDILGPERTICLAREITKKHEHFLVGSLQAIMPQFEARSKKGEFVLLIAPEGFVL